MNKIILIIFLVVLCSSCSKLSGKYSEYNEGWLGTQNSLSTYDFGSFGSVTYMNSTSGSRSSNSYYSSKGEYKIEGNKVILNFGGSDRILTISDDYNVLTDAKGNKYKKRD